MIENEIDPTLQFNTGLDKSNKLYRDRFVFPEVWAGVFRDNDEIIEKIEFEIEKRIREKMINNISNEVILKNVAEPFLNDLGTDEMNILVKIIGEMKDEKIRQDQEKPLGSANNRKPLPDARSVEEAIKGAKELLDSEAVRAGITTGEVSRETSGEIKPVGDGAALEGRIIFDEDSDDLEK